MMNTLILSSSRFGYDLLDEIKKIKDVNIIGIITLKEDSKIIMYNKIPISFWYGLGIDVFEINDINSEWILINDMHPDIIVMCGWRQIIDKKILNIPKMGIVGFHPTLLPVGRGSAPFINSIMLGLKESGVSLFYVDRGVDTGDIIGQIGFDIEDTDYVIDVYDKCVVGAKKLIKKFFPLLRNGDAPRKEQDSSVAIVFEKPSLDVNKINVGVDSLEIIYRKIRACSKPYDGAYIEHDGKRLILWKAELVKMEDRDCDGHRLYNVPKF